MPRVDFSKVNGTRDLGPLPAGKYLCRLAEVEETTTRSGDPMWKLRFEVAKGRHEGRHIRDRVAFTPKAIKRVRALCAALGLKASGKVDLTPGQIEGRTCCVRVRVDQYKNQDGQMTPCNEVQFNGYEPAPRKDEADADEGGDGGEDDDEVPF